MKRALFLMGILAGTMTFATGCNENVAYYCEVESDKPDCYDGYVCLEETVYTPSSTVGSKSKEPLQAGNQRIGLCRKPCKAANDCSYGYACKASPKGGDATYCYETDGNTDSTT